MRHPPAMPVLEPSRWARGASAFRRERALARRDGLWTSAGALRTDRRAGDEENAATILMAAVGGSVRTPPTGHEGMAMGRLPEAVWREASERSWLVFERNWEHPHEALYPELAAFKAAGKQLCELARLGSEPRENLLAVARLAALVAQEPHSTCQFVSLALGKMALRAAAERGLGREVEAALGDPSLRTVLRASALGLPPPVRPIWRHWPRSKGLWVPVSYRRRRMSPDAAARFQARTLRACRRFYRLLGNLDEADVLHRTWSDFQLHPHRISRFPLDGSRTSQTAEAFANYRERRRVAREGRAYEEPRNAWKDRFERLLSAHRDGIP